MIAHSVYLRATGWMAAVRFPARATNFSLLHSVQTDSGANSASYPMRLGNEWWSYTSIHQSKFMACCIIN
jgi:hypothetical protein